MAELAVILAILVLLFGAKKLPALADGMGKAIRNFKRGLSSDDEDVTPEEKPEITPEITPAEKQVAEKSKLGDLDDAPPASTPAPPKEAQTADQKG